ncbi:MAG: hypothetical protein MUF06_21010 [Pirellulaceae bacterium]|nr:hypothetical protein [Pirellulaceae bacterium]
MRSDKLARLETFLDRFAAQTAETRSSWALEITRQVVDDGVDLPIRMPLFRRVLFPALSEAVRQQVPGAARWLAGLAQHLYRARDCWVQLPENWQTERGLLKLALQHDPADELSRTKLVHVQARHLAFSLHEVPRGVLYGMNGATIEQCQELELWLAEFRQLTLEAGLSDEYAPLIDECAFHFAHYQRYLAERDSHRSYEQYLLGVGWPTP